MELGHLLNLMDDNFTYANYVHAINFLKDRNYSFLKGNEVELLPSKKSVILRHDVDFILNPVMPIAQLEKKLKVPATYFFLSNAPKYNLMSDECLEALDELKNMGHEIGIHIDSKKISNLDDLSIALEKEALFYKKYLNYTPKTFSYHMPTTDILQINMKSVLGMTNYYSEELFKNYSYLSDSNGYWRQLTLKNFLSNSNDQNLYILTHPIWWSEQTLTPKERLNLAFKKSDQDFEDWYMEVCHKYGRKYW